MSETSKRSRFLAFFFSKRSKNVLVFLFFFIMASAFWVIQKLDEPTTVKVTVPVKLTNVPKDVIIATDLPDEIQVTVRDKGNELLSLFWKPVLDTLRIDFNQHDSHQLTDNLILMPHIVRQMVKEKLPSQSSITEMLPDTLSFSYNRGIHRKLPVRLNGSLLPANQYNLDSYTFMPDSVEVYAPASILDTMHAAYTELQMLQDINTNRILPVPMERQRSVRIFPDTVTLDINVDILLSKKLEAYIQCTDVPEGKQLRTIPATVTVNYIVSASQARYVDESLFKVVVSYNDIKDSQSSKCKPTIANMPGSIINAYVRPQQVDFFIEEPDAYLTPERPSE